MVHIKNCPHKKAMLARNNLGISSAVLVLFGLFFLIACTLSDFQIASLASLFGFLLFGIYICIAAPSFLVKYFIILFGIIAAIAGCFSCEFLGGYLPELRVKASFAGSLPPLVLNYFVFLVCLYGFEKTFGEDDRVLLTEVPVRKEQKWFKWVHVGFTIMILIMYLHALPNPSFIHGGDRFSYSALYLNGVWRYLHSASMILCIVPLLALRYGYKKSGSLAILLFCLYLFWTGIKFSGFYELLSLATIVFYDKVANFNKTLISKILLGAFIGLGCLLGLAVFAHSFADSSDSSTEFFFNRTAQQSQLWWSTYSRYSPCQGINEISDELSGLAFGEKPIKDCQGDYYGIYKVMYMNAPSDLVDVKLASGSRYTEAAYPSIYYYFGLLGTLIFSLLTALITVFLINVMIKVVHGREVLSSLACFIIWRAWCTFRDMLLFSSLLSPSVLLSIAILLLFSRSIHNSQDISFKNQEVNNLILEKK